MKKELLGISAVILILICVCLVFIFVNIPVKTINQDLSVNDLIARDDTIKSATITISVPNTDQTRKDIFDNIDKFSGDVYWQDWYDENTIYSQGKMNVILPPDKFIPMINWLEEKYNITELTISSKNPYSNDAMTQFEKEHVRLDLSITRSRGFFASVFYYFKMLFID
jgi:hypothetical protein